MPRRRRFILPAFNGLVGFLRLDGRVADAAPVALNELLTLNNDF